MTNEEKAQEISEKYKHYKVECSSLDCYLSALEMAKWKDRQHPLWNIQDEKDIYDSVNGWDCHKYVCIMKDGKVCEWIGINDEDYEGSVSAHISPVNDEEYSIDDIMYWTELK